MPMTCGTSETTNPLPNRRTSYLSSIVGSLGFWTRSPASTPFERWAVHVDTSAGPHACWPWIGSLNVANGYGKFRGTSSHRGTWELLRFPIPKGMQVLHRCDNPPCVNPEHLFLGSVADNMRDRDAKQRARGGVNSPAVTGIRWSPSSAVEARRVISDDDLRDIRRRISDGSTHIEVAVACSLSQSTISKIASGVAPYDRAFDRPALEKRRTFICRECDHDAGGNPIDTWRCKHCKHTNVLDVTEVPVR